MKQKPATYPCPHCTNSDNSMIEKQNEWKGRNETKLIGYLCAVCGKTFLIMLNSEGKVI